MIQIEKNISLKHRNTFGIDAKSKYFIEVSDEATIQALLNNPIYRNEKHLILGGGSNVLFTGDYEGLVIYSAIKGLSHISQDEEFVMLDAGSGEGWHALVMHAVEHDWGGVENLSLIPGTVGAAPIQNIGAYGVEIKNVIENVRGIDLTTGVRRTFTNSDCRFNYRESIFKLELKEKIFVSSITLRLTKKNHRINIEYGAIRDVLKSRNIQHPTIRDVSEAVISIRASKLPDPSITGNAGSFFKNPTMHQNEYAKLKAIYPAIPSYQTDNQNVKVPAAWLIEQCGWKGKKIGEVGVHPQQALVLVNYGEANGQEILDLATRIQRSVEEKFGITLSAEVNII